MATVDQDYTSGVQTGNEKSWSDIKGDFKEALLNSVDYKLGPSFFQASSFFQSIAVPPQSKNKKEYFVSSLRHAAGEAAREGSTRHDWRVQYRSPFEKVTDTPKKSPLTGGDIRITAGSEIGTSCTGGLVTLKGGSGADGSDIRITEPYSTISKEYVNAVYSCNDPVSGDTYNQSLTYAAPQWVISESNSIAGVKSPELEELTLKYEMLYNRIITLQQKVASLENTLYLSQNKPGQPLTMNVVEQAKTARKLEANWTIVSMQDLKAQHGLDLESELSQVVSSEIVKEIVKEIDKEILESDTLAYDKAMKGIIR